jgi:two-component system osmolarity sensor histidine kinase EnvZ
LVCKLLGNGDHGDVWIVSMPPAHTALWIHPASGILLERCLFNLLDNARRYGQPPLEVRLDVLLGRAVLTVRDHGPGIPADQRETLLKPFSRGALDRGLPGSGLGLPVVERAVRRHGGEVELENANPGLRVALHLPLETVPADPM